VSSLLLVGTRKGLFLIRRGDDGWAAATPTMKGWSINHAAADPRDGSLLACTNNWVYGGAFHRSTDGGETWERSEGLAMPAGSGLTLNATWHVEPGRASQPQRLWLGVDPGGLFRSDDAGATWEPVAGLIEHPTRDRWEPGAGGLCAHSITLDADDADRLWVGISAAGVFRTEDGGRSWTPANSGTEACFFPEDRYPEVGQCVHKVLAHPGRSGRLWQQNHCGVYRSDDGGESWERVDGNGLPSGFGFPVALDPADPDVAFVVPEEGSDNRVTAKGRLGVYRTGDGGASWELVSDGLPEPAWASVKREGMSFDRERVYLGTQAGGVYELDRAAGSWSTVATDLPEILSVEIAEETS
jgi:photosystem II stability/assembly factor-like uncharacterized protein